MTMRRFLAPLPAVFDLAQQRALTFGRYASAADVNIVDNGDGTRSLAVYFDGFSPTQTSQDAWKADVVGAVVQHPTADETANTRAVNQATITAALGQAITDLANVVTDMQTLAASASPGTGTLSTLQLSNTVRQIDTSLRTVVADLSTTALALKRAARLLNGDFSSTT
jgi:hypothetical protein